MEVSVAEWERVESERLFHLEPEARGPGAQNFSPRAPVSIELQLSSMLVPLIYAVSQDPLAAGKHISDLSGGNDASPLLATESWYATRVMSDVELPPGMTGELRSGFRTTWAAQADEETGKGEYAVPLGLPMLAIVEEVLDERGWDHRQVPGREAMAWRVRSGASSWECYAVVDEQPGLMLVYSLFEFVVPEERRAEAAVLLARLNQGLPVGNWELDVDGGGLRYKTSIDVGVEYLSMALFDRLVQRNLEVVSTHLPALAGFATGALDMEAALAAAGESQAGSWRFTRLTIGAMGEVFEKVELGHHACRAPGVHHQHRRSAV